MTSLQTLSAQLVAHRKKFLDLCRQYDEWWLKLQISTEPADRERAESAIRTIYRFSNRNDGLRFLWFDSLSSMELAYRAMQPRREPADIWYSMNFRQELKDAWKGLTARCRALRRLGVGPRVAPCTSVKRALQQPLRGRRYAQITFADPGDASPLDSLAGHVVDFRMDIALVARTWFTVRVLDDDKIGQTSEIVEAHVDATRSCLCWCPFESVIMLCDRPETIHLENHELHRDGGPAVVWRDGCKAWALHGTLVPPEVAEPLPTKLTPGMSFGAATS